MRFGRPTWKHRRAGPKHQLGNNHKLQFAQDGTFQITVFSDLHLAEDEDRLKGPMQDARTVEVVNKVLDRESSQLVVLNGDLISGYGTTANNVTLYLDQILEPIIQKGLPLATTYGNHDNEHFSKSKKLFAREKEYNNSLTQNMLPDKPEAGISNYYLEVYSADQEVPQVILWFFDSRGGDESRDWVDTSVVDWFKKTSASLAQQYKKTIPSLAFFHIPIAGTYEFQQNGVSPSREPGINGEEVCWQGKGYDKKSGHDVAFMDALSDTDGLLATFSGHDHNNDWCFKWRNTAPDRTGAGHAINVCYGRHTGYGGYGNLARGGRQILLRQESLARELSTWIRLEDGLVPENVTLNATYGRDEYHPSPQRQHIELRRSVVEGAGGHVHAAAGFYSAALLMFFISIFL